MLRRHPQQNARGAAERAAGLFPMMQRADTDAQEPCKPDL